MSCVLRKVNKKWINQNKCQTFKVSPNERFTNLSRWIKFCSICYLFSFLNEFFFWYFFYFIAKWNAWTFPETLLLRVARLIFFIPKFEDLVFLQPFWVFLYLFLVNLVLFGLFLVKICCFLWPNKGDIFKNAKFDKWFRKNLTTWNLHHPSKSGRSFGSRKKCWRNGHWVRRESTRDLETEAEAGS